MISIPWCHTHDYVTLHDKRDFADILKVTNQLTSKLEHYVSGAKLFTGVL